MSAPSSNVVTPSLRSLRPMARSRYGRPRGRYTMRSRVRWANVPNQYQSLSAKKSLLTKTYSYTRQTSHTATIETTDEFPVFFHLTFTLSDLPGYGDWTALYDQYKISMVVVRFFPPYALPDYQIPTVASTNPTQIMPRLFLHTAVDLDSDADPTSIDGLREYQTYQMSDLHRAPVVVKFKPKIKCAYFNAETGQVAYGTDFGRDNWIDCNNPDTKHFCLKYGIDAWSDSGPINVANPNSKNITIPLSITYYLSFRNTQ